MSADPWDDVAPDRGPDRDQDPDNIDGWGLFALILGALFFGLVIAGVLFGGMNSGLIGSDGPADSADGASDANTTEEDTASNETADSGGNDSTAGSSEANSGGSSGKDAPPDDGDESDSSSSSDASDPGTSDTSDSGDTSDSDSNSDSNSDESQEQSNGQQEQEQSQDDSGSDDSSEDSGEDESGDERPVYDLTVHTGTEKPVSGADITIERHADGATTTRTTGEDGSVTFPVYPGDYTIRAEDPNGNVEETDVTVTSDTRVEMHTLLNERPETHTLDVTVVDQTGSPVQGAEVGGIGGTLPSGADAQAFGTTNAEGKAYLKVYEGHNYLIDVFHPDSEQVITKEIQIGGDESLRFELERSGAAQQSSENNEAAA